MISHVQPVYIETAFLGRGAFCASRIFNNLRVINRVDSSDSPRLHHLTTVLNCVCAEWNRIGGAAKKRGSQKPRATLRREVHAAHRHELCFLGRGYDFWCREIYLGRFMRRRSSWRRGSERRGLKGTSIPIQGIQLKRYLNPASNHRNASSFSPRAV